MHFLPRLSWLRQTLLLPSQAPLQQQRQARLPSQKPGVHLRHPCQQAAPCRLQQIQQQMMHTARSRPLQARQRVVRMLGRPHSRRARQMRGQGMERMKRLRWQGPSRLKAAASTRMRVSAPEQIPCCCDSDCQSLVHACQLGRPALACPIIRAEHAVCVSPGPQACSSTVFMLTLCRLGQLPSADAK